MNVKGLGIPIQNQKMLREHYYVTGLMLGTSLFPAFDLHTALRGRLTEDEETKALRAGDLP